jgi:hypothetical protein
MALAVTSNWRSLMTAARWYVRLIQREGQVGIAFENTGRNQILQAIWDLDAEGETIGELLRDLASELTDADRDQRKAP